MDDRHFSYITKIGKKKKKKEKSPSDFRLPGMGGERGSSSSSSSRALAADESASRFALLFLVALELCAPSCVRCVKDPLFRSFFWQLGTFCGFLLSWGKGRKRERIG
jgi:hypothetical protein